MIFLIPALEENTAFAKDHNRWAHPLENAWLIQVYNKPTDLTAWRMLPWLFRKMGGKGFKIFIYLEFYASRTHEMSFLYITISR